MKLRNMSATVDHVPAKWYVATKRGIVDEDVYSDDQPKGEHHDHAH